MTRLLQNLGFLDNPVLQREIRSRFRRRRTFITLTAKLLLVAILVPVVYRSMVPRTRFDPTAASEAGLYTFMTLIMVEAALLLLIAPAMSCTSFTVEKEQRTFDLVIATRLTPMEIILGKLAASQYSVLLLILASAPILFLTVFFGGLSPFQVLGAFVYCIFFSLAYGVIGLYFSLMTRKTALSVSLTYLSILLINAAPILLVLLAFGVLDERPEELPIYTALSTTPFFVLTEILLVEARKEIAQSLTIGGTWTNVLFLASLSGLLIALMVKRLRRISEGD